MSVASANAAIRSTLKHSADYAVRAPGSGTVLDVHELAREETDVAPLRLRWDLAIASVEHVKRIPVDKSAVETYAILLRLVLGADNPKHADIACIRC